MAEIGFPGLWVARDANGSPVASAQAYFYRQGTTTPLTVYADAAGSSAHPSPLVAGGNGIFAPWFNTSDYNVKIDVKHPTTGASLPGYPIDYALLVSIATGQASGITFSPTDDIAATNVQAAIEAVQANWVAAKTGADDGLVSGTAGTADAHAKWNADGDVVGGGTAFPATATAGDLLYASAENTYGNLAKGTGLQVLRMNAGASAPEWATFADWTYLAAQAATSGSEKDFTGIPATAREVEIYYWNVSFSGNDNHLVQAIVSGAPVTSGYVCGTSVTSTSTSGMEIDADGASNAITGHMRWFRFTGNDWLQTHIFMQNATGGVTYGAGRVSLAGALEGLRATRSGSATFDLGSIQVRYR